MKKNPLCKVEIVPAFEYVEAEPKGEETGVRITSTYFSCLYRANQFRNWVLASLWSSLCIVLAKLHGVLNTHIFECVFSYHTRGAANENHQGV